ncbi:hypothetical protein [Roseateles sp. P5_E11]
MTDHQFWFKSTLFEIEPGEDEETNPFCFGRQLSHWLRKRLVSQGRSVEDVIPEDWGWCLVVQRKPFLLWVGCVSVHDYANTQPDARLALGSDVVWACTVVAEATLLGKLRGVATGSAVNELFQQVHRIVISDPSNSLVGQP